MGLAILISTIATLAYAGSCSDCDKDYAYAKSRCEGDKTCLTRAAEDHQRCKVGCK